MKVAVRYYTRSGNTEKLAKAVAEAVGVEALDLNNPLEEKVDILFLGCSYYAFDVDPNVKRFIEDNNVKITKIALVGSSAGMKSMKKPVRAVADKFGIEVLEEEYHTRGKFGPMHKNRPNEKDLEEAKSFAKKVIE